MDVLSQIGASLPLLLGLILVAVALLALLLLVLFSRARDRAQYTDLSTTGSADAEGDPSSLELVDFRSSPAAADLRHSFARALRLLRKYLGHGARYQLPWFMTFGQVAAGKTTALAFTELKLPFGEPDGGPGRSPCLWWLFDRAVVIDVAGDLALRSDGASSDRPAWRELLHLLRRNRARRPLDGLLLTIPADELLGVSEADSQARSELAHRAELLRMRLDQAQSELCFDFPVYVLVTKCDLLPGFADLAATVEPQQLQQIFGWSNPSAPDVPYSDSWVDDAFDSVGSALDEQQMRTLQDNRPLAAPQGFLSLPAAVNSMRETLRIYWSQLFAGGGKVLPVRGLYFSGGEGFDVAGPAHDDDYRTWGPTPADGVHRRVDFLTELFSYKVFYEWTLSQPDKEALKRRTRLRKVLQVSLAAALLLGPMLIGWSARRLATSAGIVTQQFLSPAQRAVQSGTADPIALRQNAYTLLAAIDRVPDYRLRSVFLPPSWWSSYARGVGRAGTGIYDRIVFPALYQDLGQQLGGVTAPVPVMPPGALIYDVRSVPEFQGLSGMTRQLDGVEANADLYDRFAAGPCATGRSDWLPSFQKLVAGFDPSLRANPPTLRAEGYYQDVLCDAGGGAPFTPDPVVTGALQERALALGGEMSRGLFGEDNVLVADLDSLQRQLDDLARQAPAPSQANAVYQSLVNTIDRTAKDLADPRVSWAGGTKLDLGAPFESLMGSIAHSPYLGLRVAQTIGATCDAGFADFRGRLAGYATDPTGPLLVQKDGAVQLQLSTTIQGLRTALASLLRDYTTTPPGPGVRLTPPAGTYLSWNAQGLTSAAALLTSYTAFITKSFQGYPGFQQIVDQSTRSGVEANVLSQVGLAQNFPSIPSTTTRELREAYLQTQVANLSGASVPLNQLLQSFLKPPSVGGCPGAPASAYCQLDKALLNQRASLLQQLDGLLADQSLYAPVPKSIESWNGQENLLAWNAFAVQNAAGLAGYLTSQRRIVTALNTQYAIPILTAVPLGPAWGADTSDPYQRWTVIGSDLTDYENKAAGNAIQSLETYIGTDMAGATTANCPSLPGASGACFAPSTPAELTANPPPCDYFLGAQASLQKEATSRCAVLTSSAATAAYGRIKSAFDSRLLGKYPFAAAGVTNGASPADLRAFFSTFDAEKTVVNAFLAGKPGQGWQRVSGFMTAMGEVRDFSLPSSTRQPRSRGRPRARHRRP